MKQRVIQYTLAVIAAALIIIGIAQGDYSSTRQKAIVICLECIGIG